MTCNICKYEWCWLCGATYTNIHFAPFNPFGCAGLQGGAHQARNWSWWKRILYKIVVFVLIVGVGLPLAAVLSGPIFAIYVLSNSYPFRYKFNLAVKIISVVLAIPVGKIYGI